MAVKTVEPFSDTPGFTLLGWPDETPCVRCGARSVHLSSTVADASYECRGTPADSSTSDYGPDACHLVFRLERSS